MAKINDSEVKLKFTPIGDEFMRKSLEDFSSKYQTAPEPKFERIGIVSEYIPVRSSQMTRIEFTETSDGRTIELAVESAMTHDELRELVGQVMDK